ncbi:MAG: hypothetical protein WCR36_03455 [Bacteroidaceae bacterium]
MLEKGSKEYKKAQELACKLSSFSDIDRIFNHSYFSIAFQDLSDFLNEFKDGFASQVAATIKERMDPYSRKVSFISNKQAWILAVYAVEKGLHLKGFEFSTK